MTRRSHPASSPDGGGEVRMPRRRATTIAPEGRLVLAESSANSRLFVYMIGNYLHRIERERRTVYFGDLDLARVAEIIGAAGVEPGMRDALFRAQHGTFDSIIGVAGQRAVNATSIASATGIPRETVRRKLKRLLKLGVIVEKGRARYVLKPGVLQEPERQAAFARGIQQTVLFMNECLENGVVRWVDGGKAERK
jgi:DNA-binding transcriptional ArsR family regulator